MVMAMQRRFTPDFSRKTMIEFAVPNGGRCCYRQSDFGNTCSAIELVRGRHTQPLMK
jgi:hypothetical protein